mgnify:CR=1 FL=1
MSSHLLLALLTFINILNFVDRQLIASFANDIKPDLDLNNFQKSLVLFMTPLPFAYIGPLSIYRLANDKSLGYAHLVSFQLTLF